MNIRKLYFISFISFSMALFAQKENQGMKLWYNKSVTCFEEAFPLCNGRIGVMVYVDMNNELLNINEATLWGGGPNTNPTPDAPTYLPMVREELFKGNWDGASTILKNIQRGNQYILLPKID